MKKLMIALAIITMAAMTQAASFDWKTSATGKIYEAGTSTLLASGTAYIFDVAMTTQQSVLDAFAKGETWTTGNLNSKAIASGVISATGGEAFTASGADSFNFYVVLLNGDDLFISDTVNATAKDVGYETVQFKLATASKASAIESSTFSAGGWYTASAPVPEPTSGLLMLIGMAGLALRRRRA